MTKVLLICKNPVCSYQRELDLTDAEIAQLYKTHGVIELDTTEEGLHHLNNFADHGYNHGLFIFRTKDRNDALLEVTHDFESRPIFYPSGERK